jgi:hypothetical protein
MLYQLQSEIDEPFDNGALDEADFDEYETDMDDYMDASDPYDIEYDR